MRNLIIYLYDEYINKICDYAASQCNVVGVCVEILQIWNNV